MDKKECENTALLLIGSTGNGKSTLGNFLIDPDKSHMFGEKPPKFPMARSNRPETQNVSCKEFTHKDRYIFSVIDTPGLNESAERDLIHMGSLIEVLSDPNLEGVRACLLCVKFNSKIDAQYKATVAYYSRLLPSLFEGNVLIIMTEFMTDDRAEKLRKMQGIDVESVKKNASDEIRDSARLAYPPPLFTIDCLPMDKSEREYSSKVRESILEYILQLSNVSTANLKVEKTDYLKQLDAKEIGRMKGEITGYNKRLMEVNEAATEVLTKVEHLKREILDVEGDIANTKNELAVKDSDDLTVANSWNVDRSSKILRTLHETFEVPSKWKIEKVALWKNSPAQWKDVHQTEYKVSGSLQGQWMRGLHASVTLETKKRTKYAKEIDEMKIRLEELEGRLNTLQEEAVVYDQHHIEFQKEIDLLNAYIEERKSAIEKLYVNSMSVTETMKRVDELQQKFKEIQVTRERKREVETSEGKKEAVIGETSEGKKEAVIEEASEGKREAVIEEGKKEAVIEEASEGKREAVIEEATEGKREAVIEEATEGKREAVIEEGKKEAVIGETSEGKKEAVIEEASEGKREAVIEEGKKEAVIEEASEGKREAVIEEASEGKREAVIEEATEGKREAVIEEGKKEAVIEEGKKEAVIEEASEGKREAVIEEASEGKREAVIEEATEGKREAVIEETSERKREAVIQETTV